MELVEKKNISYLDSKSHDGARKYFKDKYGRCLFDGFYWIGKKK